MKTLWVRCSEEMPEPNGVLRYVTIQTADRDPFISWAAWQGAFWTSQDGDLLIFEKHEVTHWYPSPAPMGKTIAIST